MLTSESSKTHGASAVVGKVKILSKLAWLVEEIEATLEQEKKSYTEGDESNENIKGWIEALQYVLRQIEVIVE